jgi:Family of unknown function (DUF6236)
MKRILLDPGGSVDQSVSTIPTKKGVENLRSKLAFFDQIATIKERYPPAAFRAGESFRRLTDFDDPIGQNYLAEKRLYFAHDIRGNQFLAAAIDEMTDYLLNQDPIVDLIIPDRIAQQLHQTNPCIVFKAIDGFTIPPDDVALEDILLFKERRRAEYEAFWHCVDEIANEVEWLGAPDSLTALKGNLLAALGDYERVNSEKWGRRVVDSMSLKFAIGAKQAIALGAAAITNYANMPEILTLLAGAAGLVEFSVELCPSTRPLSDRARAMSYASRVRTLS